MNIVTRKGLGEFLLRVHRIATDQFIKSGVCEFDKDGTCAQCRWRLAEFGVKSVKGKWKQYVQKVRLLRKKSIFTGGKNCCVGCSELGKNGCLTRNPACSLYVCAYLVCTYPKFVSRIVRIKTRTEKMLEANFFQTQAIEGVFRLVRMRYTHYLNNIVKLQRD